MELSDEFTVSLPVDRAFAVLTDVERIAHCLPGAELQEVDGEKYRGVVKVKVGPITAQYKGVAHFLERDPTAHRAVLRAEGRDTRGQGNASATVTATMEQAGAATRVSVLTDLTITGKVAQFGRGVLAEVSTKLLGQFVDCLEATVIAAGDGGPAATASHEAGGPDDAPARAAGGTGSAARAGKVGSRSSGGAAPARTAGKSGDAPASERARRRAGSEGSSDERAGAEGSGDDGAGAEAAGGEPSRAADGAEDAEGSGGAASRAAGGADGPAGGGSGVTRTSADAPPTPEGASAARSGPRAVAARPAEPVDLLEVAGPSVLKRAVPVVLAAGLLGIVLTWLRRARRRRP